MKLLIRQDPNYRKYKLIFMDSNLFYHCLFILRRETDEGENSSTIQDEAMNPDDEFNFNNYDNEEGLFVLF